MIGIIDYEAGNLLSVKKALDYLNIDNFISGDINELEKADGFILPGVGAFPKAMENIKKKGLDIFIKTVVKTKPLLGICLGMQLLFDYSLEFEKCNGLSLIPGYIDKIPDNNKEFKIPHMGWNSLNITKKSNIINNIVSNDYVYFVHSYMAVTESENIAASCTYSCEIPAVVQRGNVYGMQFHPEKSAEKGLILIKNFKKIVEESK